MSFEPSTVVIGNLTADPDLRYTSSGVAYAKFTVAATPRSFDKSSNGWKDGETLFMRCTAWREIAVNIAESVSKGDRVIVSGRLIQNKWQTPEGDNRYSIDLTVDEVGASLRFAQSKVVRMNRSNGAQNAAGDLNDPWGTSGHSNTGSSVQREPEPVGAAAGFGEPPF